MQVFNGLDMAQIRLKIRQNHPFRASGRKVQLHQHWNHIHEGEKQTSSLMKLFFFFPPADFHLSCREQKHHHSRDNPKRKAGLTGTPAGLLITWRTGEDWAPPNSLFTALSTNSKSGQSELRVIFNIEFHSSCPDSTAAD